LGDISYSLYLGHPLIPGMLGGIPTAAAWWFPTAKFLTQVLFAVILSIGTFRLVEQPCRIWIRKHLSPVARAPRTAPWVVASFLLIGALGMATYFATDPFRRADVAPAVVVCAPTWALEEGAHVLPVPDGLRIVEAPGNERHRIVAAPIDGEAGIYRFSVTLQEEGARCVLLEMRDQPALRYARVMYRLDQKTRQPVGRLVRSDMRALGGSQFELSMDMVLTTPPIFVDIALCDEAGGLIYDGRDGRAIRLLKSEVARVLE